MTVTQEDSITVGTEEDKPTLSPSRMEKEPIGIGSLSPTSTGSHGGTYTVSTETTGPPTLADRPN